MVPKICFSLEKERLLLEDWKQFVKAESLSQNMIVKEKGHYEMVIFSKSEHLLLYNSFAPVAIMKKMDNGDDPKIQVTLRLAKSTSALMLVFGMLAVLMSAAMVIMWLIGELLWSWLFLLPVGIYLVSYLLAWGCFYVSARRIKAWLLDYNNQGWQ